MGIYDYRPQGVCCKNIQIELSEDKSTITSVVFEGGCNGHLKAIATLIAGRSVAEVCELLRGNTCGSRASSCADQLVCALTHIQSL